MGLLSVSPPGPLHLQGVREQQAGAEKLRDGLPAPLLNPLPEAVLSLRSTVPEVNTALTLSSAGMKQPEQISFQITTGVTSLLGNGVDSVPCVQRDFCKEWMSLGLHFCL